MNYLNPIRQILLVNYYIPSLKRLISANKIKNFYRRYRIKNSSISIIQFYATLEDAYIGYNRIRDYETNSDETNSDIEIEIE